jgi:hypothetical protein
MTFYELDTSGCGTVRFDDGSMVAIKGPDIVLFKCKSNRC